MNIRLAIAALLVAAGLATAAFYLTREPAKGQETPAVDPRPAGVGPDATQGGVQIPADGGSTAGVRNAPSAPPAGQDAPPLEPVFPLLELNLVADGGAGLASVDELHGQIEEMLGGKHADKTTTQLERSFWSVEAVLRSQMTPDLIPKEQILSPEALNALTIERDWLKQKIRG